MNADELDALDWDARAQAIFEADDFAREHVQDFGVQIVSRVGPS